MGSEVGRITIGLPVYNGERYLADSLRSILGQSFSDFRLIISDNGSTDATQEICLRAAEVDSRIRYVRQARNIGVNRNHAAVFDLADPKSEFFRWAAADDLIETGLLEDMVRVLERDPGVVAVVPDTNNINEAGSFVRHLDRTLDLQSDRPAERVAAVLGRSYQMVFPQGLMRSAVLRSTARRWAHFGWDFSLLLELALRGRLAQPPMSKLLRREHPGETSRVRTLPEIRRWVDPEATSRWFCPHWRWTYERLRATLLAPVGLGDKLECLRLVVMSAIRGRHLLYRDLVGSTRLWLGRTDEIPF